MLSGSITALVTPFKNGQVDEQAFQDFVEWQIEQGTHGLVPCGTTGESATLTDEEHQRVIRLCVEAAAGRVPVVAGAGSNETRVAIKYVKHAKEYGADAALVVTPYYNKPNQDGLFAHFEAISQAVDLPVVVYNIPGRSVVDIQTETMARISRLPHVIGTKDATSDISRVTLYRRFCKDGFIQLSGDDPTALGYRAQGGHGCISVSSNVLPKMCSEFHELCNDQDFAAAREYHDKLIMLHKDLFCSPSPGPAKYLLAEMGKMQPDVRLPITPPSAENKTKIMDAFKASGSSL